MSLIVSGDLIANAKHIALTRLNTGSVRGKEVYIDTDNLPDDALNELINEARANDDTKTARAAHAIALARVGTFDKPVPNFKAFQGMLSAFLKADCIDGWIYVTGADDKLYPQLVTAVTYEHGYPPEAIHTFSFAQPVTDFAATATTKHHSAFTTPLTLLARMRSQIVAWRTYWLGVVFTKKLLSCAQRIWPRLSATVRSHKTHFPSNFASAAQSSNTKRIATAAVAAHCHHTGRFMIWIPKTLGLHAITQTHSSLTTIQTTLASAQFQSILLSAYSTSRPMNSYGLTRTT